MEDERPGRRPSMSETSIMGWSLAARRIISQRTS